MTPGGEGGWRCGCKVIGPEEEDNDVPGAPAGEGAEDGEHKTERTGAMLKDTGGKVEAHQRGDAAW